MLALVLTLLLRAPIHWLISACRIISFSCDLGNRGGSSDEPTFRPDPLAALATLSETLCNAETKALARTGSTFILESSLIALILVLRCSKLTLKEIS
jgi:hypothetical protein